MGQYSTKGQENSVSCLAKCHNKKIPVLILTFQVDNLGESDIIIFVPSRTVYHSPDSVGNSLLF